MTGKAYVAGWPSVKAPGIAPGVDFGDRLEAALTPVEPAALDRGGRLARASPEYPDDPWTVTRAMVEDAERRRLLDAPIAIDCPVRLLHGAADPDVPADVSVRLAERLMSGDVEVTLLKNAGHLLRDDAHVARVAALLGEVLDRVG